MIRGAAFKPYVYRALIGWIVRYTVALWPGSLKDAAISVATHDRRLEGLLRATRFDPDYFPESVTAVAVMFVSLLLFARAVRELFKTLYEASPLASEVVALVALIGLQTMFNYQNYIYDFPTIALFSLGLQLLAQERFSAFFAVYLVGLFSKETVVLLAVVFVLNQWRVMAVKRFAGLSLALCAGFGASRLFLNFLYSRNLGEYLLPQFVEHNLTLLHSYPPSSLVTAGLFAVVVFGHWGEKPIFARNALWIVAPLLASCLCFGFLDELRDYYEVYPVVVLLGAMSVGRWMAIPITTRCPAIERRPMPEWLGPLMPARGAAS